MRYAALEQDRSNMARLSTKIRDDPVTHPFDSIFVAQTQSRPIHTVYLSKYIILTACISTLHSKKRQPLLKISQDFAQSILQLGVFTLCFPESYTYVRHRLTFFSTPSVRV